MNRRAYRSLTTGTLGFAALFSLQHASAQEALLAARSATDAAKARSQAVQTGGYDHTTSSLSYRLGAGLAFEYTDNANLSGSNADEDFSVKTTLSSGMTWNVSENTRLGVTASVGYSHYFNDSDRSGLDFSLSPTADNNIGFEIFAGDWMIYLYDNFGVRTDPIRDATVSNEDEIVEFSNTAGAQAVYNMGQSSISAGYAFKKNLFRDSKFEDSDRSSHLFHAGYQNQLNAVLTVGLESSASLSIYDSGKQNDMVVYTLGPNVQWLPTDVISITAGGGPSWITYSANDTGLTPDDRSSFYLYAKIDHRFSEFAYHSLAANRSTASATQSSDNESLSFDYSLNLDIIVDTSLTFSAFYETGEARSGINRTAVQGATKESYDRTGASVRLGRSFGDKLSGSLAYSFTHRDSKAAGRDYDQNRVTLSFNYKF